MDSGVFLEDAAYLLDRLGGGLSRVARMHDQLGFDAVDMRALVFDDSIITVPGRLVAFYWYDRVDLHPRSDRRRG